MSPKRVVDDSLRIANAIQLAAQSHDLVLTSGGVSVGEADYIRSAVENIGHLVFWHLAIKPGRPVAFGLVPGKTGEQCFFIGLPGNPVAAFVTFARFVRPLLLRLAGATSTPLLALPVRAAFSHKKRKGLREYVRVSLKPDAKGAIQAFKHPHGGAAAITSLTETDRVVELSEDIAAGATVGFFSYAVLAG